MHRPIFHNQQERLDHGANHYLSWEVVAEMLYELEITISTELVDFPPWQLIYSICTKSPQVRLSWLGKSQILQVVKL
jgi:hypothetical protein